MFRRYWSLAEHQASNWRRGETLDGATGQVRDTLKLAMFPSPFSRRRRCANAGHCYHGPAGGMRRTVGFPSRCSGHPNNGYQRAHNGDLHASYRNLIIFVCQYLNGIVC